MTALFGQQKISRLFPELSKVSCISKALYIYFGVSTSHLYLADVLRCSLVSLLWSYTQLLDAYLCERVVQHSRSHSSHFTLHNICGCNSLLNKLSID